MRAGQLKLKIQLLNAADSPAVAVLSSLLLADPKPPRQGVSPDTPSAGKSVGGRSRKSDP